jgi:DNA-directed RNA polymerase subunit K/omega
MAETDDLLVADRADAPTPPRLKAPPIESRFLYVDVAAMRAKQLRRGALSRLATDDQGPADTTHRVIPFKAERIAMEEVRRGLVLYEVPGNSRPGEAQ